MENPVYKITLMGLEGKAPTKDDIEQALQDGLAEGFDVECSVVVEEIPNA